MSIFLFSPFFTFLRVETQPWHEPSLSPRRLKVSVSNVTKVRSRPDEPAYSCVLGPQSANLSEAYPAKILPFGIRILHARRNLD